MITPASSLADRDWRAWAQAWLQTRATEEGTDWRAIWHNVLWFGELGRYPSVFQVLSSPPVSALPRWEPWVPWVRWRWLSQALTHGETPLAVQHTHRAPLKYWRPRLHRVPVLTNRPLPIPHRIFSPTLCRADGRPAAAAVQGEAFLDYCRATGFAPSGYLRELVDRKLRDLLALVDAARRALEGWRPRLVVVLGDGFREGLALTLAAGARDTPVLHVAHGLDCDPFCYDHAWAPWQAVPGRWRAERYRRDSARPHRSWIFDAGVRFETPPVRVDYPPLHDATRKLLVTRPHALEKCYLPGCSPGDGLASAQAVAALPGSLRVRPHPQDAAWLYETHGLALDRSARLREAVTEADVVFCEDSTAAIEILAWGKPVVGVHASPGEPVIPFAELGCPLWRGGELAYPAGLRLSFDPEPFFASSAPSLAEILAEVMAEVDAKGPGGRGGP